MIKKLIGISLIGFGVFLEVLWLGVCFGTVIVGILLLIFAPRILFFPFTFFTALGAAFLINPKQTYYKDNTYNNNSNQSSHSYNNFGQKANELDKYYEMLESTPSDDFATIKNNYRRLIKEYHYDTIASKNLPEQMLKFAEEKTKELNEAYTIIKKIKTDERVT